MSENPLMDEAILARFIKEIGRGKNAARDLSREDAKSLFEAMLASDVPDLQRGAILIALRVKGESLDELAGFAAACEASYPHLAPIAWPSVPSAGRLYSAVRPERRAAESKNEEPPAQIPVVIPSYNGARQLPNLVPLLALLLAREGIPVLVHGVTEDPARVTTREVFEALSIKPAASRTEASTQLASARIAFLPIHVLAPEVAAMLALRKALGVRNSAHTLVKMLQPFACPALRIVSVTHPDYLVRMREYFTKYDDAALLLRGAEGEAVAHPRREPLLEWAFAGAVQTWTPESFRPRLLPRAPASASELPSRDAHDTARWIESVLAGETPVPRVVEHQIECCKHAVAALAAGRSAAARSLE